MKKSVLKRKKKLQLLLVAAMVLLPILMTSRFSIAGNLESSVKNPDTLVYATIGEVDTWDPAGAYDSFSWMVVSNCYDTLIAYDGEEVDRFVPQIATEVPTFENGGISPDGMTYRFHIRSGVTFGNGYPVTPEDIEYSIERVMLYDIGPSWMLLEPLTGFIKTVDWHGKVNPEVLDAITQVVEVDGDDVVFNLARPYAPFLQILAQPPASIVNKQWCIENGDWPGTRATMRDYNRPDSSPLEYVTVGAGPFTLESLSLEGFVLGRNELYWRGPAKLKRVEIQTILDWDTRKQMFLEGDADIVDGVPVDARAELDGVEGIRVYTGLPQLVVQTIIPNINISPISGFVGSGMLDGNGIPLDFFDDLDIRKAFAYAFDYQGIIDELFGGDARQPASIIIEGLPYHNPDQEKYHFDLSEAEYHFRQAMGGRVWQNGFTFTIPYNHGNNNSKVLCDSIEAQVEAINPGLFHIDVVGVSLPEFYWGAMFGELPLVVGMGWGADYPDPDNFVKPFMQTSQRFTTMSGYSDPHVDYLFGQGNFETNTTAREVIYFELQQIYHDDVVGIPIAQPLGRHYERDWVHGWYHNPMTSIDFYSIWKALPADADVAPETLKLGSGGNWISLYIELLYDIDPEEIDLATVSLKYNDFSQPAVIDPRYDFVTDPSVYIVDHDGDGVLERLVRIDKAYFVSYILIDFDQHTRSIEVEIRVEGKLYDGTPFVARGTVRILN